MTGLDSKRDVILEVACIATDWDFREIASFEQTVYRSDDVLATMDPWCIAHHGESGLTEQVKQSVVSSEEAESMVMEFIEKHFDGEKPVLLAGNSIHQDRRFIEVEWPRMQKRLHYRMLDVSAWKVVFEGKYRKRFTKPEEHRALEDIRGSIMELKYYLGKVKV